MVQVKLTLEQVKGMSNVELLGVLSQCPNYVSLKQEFEGKYCCTYSINGTTVWLFNEVGGYVKSYVSNLNDEAARIFAIRSELLTRGYNVEPLK
jgi:hypothetical protein